MPKAKTRDEAWAARVTRFQAEIDRLPMRGTGHVIEVGPAHAKYTIEYRGERLGWETKQHSGHVGMFKSSGEAMNAAWELEQWTLAPEAQTNG